MKPRTPALTATLALLTAFAIPAARARAAGTDGFSMEILVDGTPLPELYGRGQVYVEALRERPYAIRVTNPLGVRAAVALAVDGRNTIDASRSSAWGASKWVLEPYESVVISGWQVDGATARKFTFTTERKSYAAWLGDASNLGVIEAVFFRERTRLPTLPPPPPPRPYSRRDSPREGAASGSAAPSVAEQAPAAPESRAEAQKKAYEPADSESAATGMGDPTRHDVTQVAIDLEGRPAAQVRIRYEYRPQLVSLGLVPRQVEPRSRRERATGFSSYCPEPPRW